MDHSQEVNESATQSNRRRNLFGRKPPSVSPRFSTTRSRTTRTGTQSRLRRPAAKMDIVDDVKTPWNQPVPRSPLQAEIDQVLHDFFANLRRVALAALVKTENLTPTEQFALCWASGVPVEYKDGKFQTSVKCSVVRIDDHWRIFQGVAEEAVTKTDHNL